MRTGNDDTGFGFAGSRVIGCWSDFPGLRIQRLGFRDFGILDMELQG